MNAFSASASKYLDFSSVVDCVTYYWFFGIVDAVWSVKQQQEEQMDYKNQNFISG